MNGNGLSSMHGLKRYHTTIVNLFYKIDCTSVINQLTFPYTVAFDVYMLARNGS